MQVLITSFFEKMGAYKKPLYVHGIGNVFSEILDDLKQMKEGWFISFLRGFGYSERMFYYYRRNERGIPVRLLLRILENYHEATGKDTKKVLARIYPVFSGISSRGNAPVKLPKVYSNELAYLCGFVLGDGHISKRLEVVIWEETEEHARYLVELIGRLFQYRPTVIKERNYHIIAIYSAPIHFFFTSFIGFTEGRKKKKEMIPSFVNLTREFQLNFLRGLFDSDGGVTISKEGKRSLLLSSSNEELLKEVASLLKGFGIELSIYRSGSRSGFELRSFSEKVIETFNHKIGFAHPVKLSRSTAPVA